MDELFSIIHLNDDKDRMRVRYRFGEAELEADGPVSDVNYHVGQFLSALAAVGSANSKLGQKALPHYDQLPLITHQQTGTEASGRDVINGSDVQSQQEGIVAFMARMQGANPKLTQHDQLMLLTYYFTKFESRLGMDFSDYKDAFLELEQLPLAAPRNMSARLSELTKSGMLYVKEGQYSLTLKGKSHAGDVLLGGE